MSLRHARAPGTFSFDAAHASRGSFRAILPLSPPCEVCPFPAQPRRFNAGPHVRRREACTGETAHRPRSSSAEDVLR